MPLRVDRSQASGSGAPPFIGRITKQRAYPGGEIYLAPRLHPELSEIELYVVSSHLPGLDAGVYHFNPGMYRYGFYER